MKTITILFFCLSSISAWVQNEAKVQDQIMGFVSFYTDRVNSLADAIPDDKYGWKPSEEVRSAGEVIMHMAATNYWLAMKFGATPPSDIDLMTYEKSVSGKGEIKATLARSYEFIV